MRRLSQKLKANEPTESARKSRCGRKRVVTPRGSRVLYKIAREFRRASHANVKKKFEEAGCSVSVRTVRRKLYELGFKCRRPIKKPRLTPAMIKKRLSWANAHKHLTVDDWRIVSPLKLSDFHTIDFIVSF